MQKDLSTKSKLCLLLLVVGMVPMFTNCDNDNENTPSKLIVGRWQLIQQPGLHLRDSNYYLEFHSNGTYIEDFRNNVRKGDYNIKKNWSYNEESKKYKGVIIIKRYKLNDSPEDTLLRNFIVDKDEMRLWYDIPDGWIPFISNVQKFVRVK